MNDDDRDNLVGCLIMLAGLFAWTLIATLAWKSC